MEKTADATRWPLLCGECTCPFERMGSRGYQCAYYRIRPPHRGLGHCGGRAFLYLPFPRLDDPLRSNFLARLKIGRSITDTDVCRAMGDPSRYPEIRMARFMYAMKWLTDY
eukprot:scaffold547_cov99-Isochrysis_galbana.AAC.9